MAQNFFSGMGQDRQQQKQKEHMQRSQISQQQEGQLQQEQLLNQQQQQQRQRQHQGKLDHRLCQEEHMRQQLGLQMQHQMLQQRLLPQQQGEPQASGSQTRKRKTPVKDEDKTDAYWERRKKNNEAAKRSRDVRRAKEAEGKSRLEQVEEYIAVLNHEHRLLRERHGVPLGERMMSEEEAEQVVAEVRRKRESNSKLDNAHRLRYNDIIGISEISYRVLRTSLPPSSSSTEASNSPPQNEHYSRGSFKEEDCFPTNPALNATPVTYPSPWPSQQPPQPLFAPTAPYSNPSTYHRRPHMYPSDPSATPLVYYGRPEDATTWASSPSAACRAAQALATAPTTMPPSATCPPISPWAAGSGELGWPTRDHRRTTMDC